MIPLTMYRGDSREITITATADLDGSVVWWTARRMDGSNLAVIEKVSGAGIELGAETTQAVVTLDSIDTDTLRPTVLHWDVEVNDTAGKVYTVAEGYLTIKGDRTYLEDEGS